VNKSILVGRLTKDLELKRTNTNNDYIKFSVAVNRHYSNNKGERQADFINCVAWGQTAKFIATYFEKGSMIGIEGSIQTGSYEKNGQRVYTTEVLVEHVEFVGHGKNSKSQDNNSYNNTTNINTNANNSYGYQKDPINNGISNYNNNLDDIYISEDELPF
jgi:single-strand DNA-binding protein